MRVQIPAYTDMWMRGDRFGEVVKVSNRFKVHPRHGRIPTNADIAHVKLDISGKTVRVLFDDCTVV